MTPIERALAALEGLSVGDAFGECFFGPAETALMRIGERALRSPPWTYTDDTEMAMSIFSVLRDFEHIDQDELAPRFADNMTPTRGYGAGAYKMLSQVDFGESWRELSQAAFNGKGSFGNGSAMRVAPVGAYFADDLNKVVEQAARSAEVTHAHPEGIAGGIAAAVATALLTQRAGDKEPVGPRLMEVVRDLTPAGLTRDGIVKALGLPSDATVVDAARALGNGAAVTSQDTVPLCLWVASRRSHNYEEALWETVSALGDRDTTCAIVGGMVVMQTGVEGIPAAWRATRERLPNMTLAVELEKHFFG
jgi:ADP-ribosylglycohydrolase